MSWEEGQKEREREKETERENILIRFHAQRGAQCGPLTHDPGIMT